MPGPFVSHAEARSTRRAATTLLFFSAFSATPRGNAAPHTAALAQYSTRVDTLAPGVVHTQLRRASFGAVLAHWYDGRVRSTPNPERAERLGTLVASGLIVGESIWGVINAGLIVSLSKDAPIGIVPEDFAIAPWLGVLGFVGAIVWLYGWMLRKAGARATA